MRGGLFDSRGVGIGGERVGSINPLLLRDGDIGRIDIVRLTKGLAKRGHNGSSVGLAERRRRERAVGNKELSRTSLARNTHGIITSINRVSTRLASSLKNKRFNRREADIVDVGRRGRGGGGRQIDVGGIPSLRLHNEVAVGIRHRADNRVHTRPEINEVEVEFKVAESNRRQGGRRTVRNENSSHIVGELGSGNLNTHTANVPERNQLTARSKEAAEGQRERELACYAVRATRGRALASVQRVEGRVLGGKTINTTTTERQFNLKTRLGRVINLGLPNHIVKAAVVIDGFEKRTTNDGLHALNPRGGRDAAHLNNVGVRVRVDFE